MGLARAIAPIICLLVSAIHAAAGDATNSPIDPSKYDHPIKVACVGDSITAGVGTSQGTATSWDGDMGRMLGKKWKVSNFGSSARTLLNKGDIPYQTKGAFKQAIASDPDVVIIMLGSNDTKPQNWSHKEDFAADYKDLIEKFQKLPTHPRIFICHPPFVPGAGNFGITEKVILEENPMIDQVAADTKSSVIDVHGATADHPELFKDRVHPNDEGAILIARTVYQAVTGTEFKGEIPMPPAKREPATKQEKQH